MDTFLGAVMIVCLVAIIIIGFAFLVHVGWSLA